MQVSFNQNTQNTYGNQPNFKSLKKIIFDKSFRAFVDDGALIKDEIVSSLKANDSFNKLCKDYDVTVSMQLKCQHPQDPKCGFLLDKGIYFKIFAQKIDKSFLGLFKKKEYFPVTDIEPSYIEARTWDIVDLIKYFIREKDGLEKDISDFMKKMA